MAITNYYETFYIQKRVETPDGFDGVAYKYEDGDMIMGLFIQSDSMKMRMAEAQYISSGGTFVTGTEVQVKEDDVIRRTSDDLYLTVTGMPVMPPKFAISQFQKMSVSKTIG